MEMIEEIDVYNPTCCVTGRKDNLRMYPIRNYLNSMIGWVFLHESVDRSEWNLDFSYNPVNQPNIEEFTHERKNDNS